MKRENGLGEMVELFQRERSVNSKHIKNVFEEGELLRNGNVQILHIANSDKLWIRLKYWKTMQIESNIKMVII